MTTEKTGPCGHHYSWGQRCQQPADAEVHKWGVARYGHSTPDGLPRHPWEPLYADGVAPASEPVAEKAPQPADAQVGEREAFDQWMLTRDDGGEKIEPRHGNAQTCGYMCRSWGHSDECLRAAWGAALRSRPAPDAEVHGTPDWQREHDSLLENVVRICLESRRVDPARQAAYLRDELLTMCDPLMLVTERLAAAKKES